MENPDNGEWSDEKMYPVPELINFLTFVPCSENNQVLHTVRLINVKCSPCFASASRWPDFSVHPPFSFI
jgi:hypothetical protein